VQENATRLGVHQIGTSPSLGTRRPVGSVTVAGGIGGQGIVAL
jgi:hypothetical protein